MGLVVMNITHAEYGFAYDLQPGDAVRSKILTGPFADMLSSDSGLLKARSNQAINFLFMLSTLTNSIDIRV